MTLLTILLQEAAAPKSVGLFEYYYDGGSYCHILFLYDSPAKQTSKRNPEIP